MTLTIKVTVMKIKTLNNKTPIFFLLPHQDRQGQRPFVFVPSTPRAHNTRDGGTTLGRYIKGRNRPGEIILTNSYHSLIRSCCVLTTSLSVRSFVCCVLVASSTQSCVSFNSM